MAKISQKLVSCLSGGCLSGNGGSVCPGMGEAKPAMVQELHGSPPASESPRALGSERGLGVFSTSILRDVEPPKPHRLSSILQPPTPTAFNHQFK